VATKAPTVVELVWNGRLAFSATLPHTSLVVDSSGTARPLPVHFDIEAQVPRDAIERAIQLSRDKYCSVWHSMRQDIDLQVTFDLTP